MEKDTNYYNNESSVYSEKRYFGPSNDYNHFFFKRRLKLLEDLIRGLKIRNRKSIVLEIGCADGVVLRHIAKLFPYFEKLTGIDISRKMIEVAKKKNNDKRCVFAVRQSEIKEKFDLIIEVGVLNLVDLREELDFVKEHLKQDSYYICSIANANSLRAKLKFNERNDGFKHLLSFPEYEKELSKRFIIEKSEAYGLFIPHIWKIPLLARILQPISEWLLRSFFSDLFHEKIYLLRLK